MTKRFLLVSSTLFLMIFLSISCGEGGFGSGSASRGEQLAKTYCGSCHVFPDPALLDKQTWEHGVLPVMAELMHVNLRSGADSSTSPADDTSSLPTISRGDWDLIVRYYRDAAPATLPARADSLAPVLMEMPQFSHVSVYGRFDNPMTTLVQIDTSVHKLYFADGNAGKLFAIQSDFSRTDSFRTSAGAVDLRAGKSLSVVSIGSITPTDQPRGRLETLVSGTIPETVVSNLRRPVQALYADLNADGMEDFILAEFGFRKGALSWVEKKPDGSYERHMLRNQPGASRVAVHDFNRDGRPDIAALMAQGQEGVFLYYNEGENRFREEQVLSFPSVYGSNYFQVFDFNADGHMDILTTQGDNADYSIVFKPYHGIRIFYNDGQNHFAEKQFLPVYGAQKAIPGDFDLDGDIDLVSIAYYPHYERHPEESFLFWENTGNNQYRRRSFNGYADGRWLTMDAGDMDGDGDLDILLGSALLPVGQVPQPLVQNWQRGRVSITILQNNRMKK